LIDTETYSVTSNLDVGACGVMVLDVAVAATPDDTPPPTTCDASVDNGYYSPYNTWQTTASMVAQFLNYPTSDFGTS